MPPNTSKPPDPSTTSSYSLPAASHLLTSFTHFLTVAIHNILYYRHLYPQPTFLTARSYNLPVHQSRHPLVCAWVRDAVDAVSSQIAAGAVHRLALVLYGPDPAGAPVLERWMFDVAAFPAWPASVARAHAAHAKGKGRAATAAFFDRDRDDHNDDRDDDKNNNSSSSTRAKNTHTRLNWTDLDEQMRAAVRRLAHAAEKMEPLPEGCTFTVAVELRDESEAPIGHPQPWIPTQPNLQTKSKDRDTPGDDVGGTKTIPLRAVEAGPMFFECWVEEGKAKAELNSQSFTTSSSQ
ncbi:DNA-binding protein [Xylariaceae sp. FL0016]|nr:DNA-binding protein [Xylariaceae sp. FL0016]